MIASGCDYVLMATPPAFRPVHFAAAVEAGKHCFIEKPVAVDPVGARSVIATGEKAAAKGLAVVTGTQRRHTAGYLRNKALIDAGAIGAIRGGVVQWNGTVPWIKRREQGESDASYLARNWLNFTEMSGDHIVEQHVHNLDVAVWFLGRLPVSAVGIGGRARRETGNMFDFFSIDYDFGDDVHIHSQCRQISGTYRRVGEIFTGTHGVCLGGGKLTGKEIEVPEIKLDSDNGMVQEHVDMIRGVMTGKPLNDAKRIAEVTLVAIMGRVSAYTGEMVRWNDIAENDELAILSTDLHAHGARFRKRRDHDAGGSAAGARQGVMLGLRRLRREERLAAELGVFPLVGEQLGVGALFDDLAHFEHVDAVRVLDGGKAVGDDEGGAVLHQVVERVLDLALGLGIDGGGGLV